MSNLTHPLPDSQENTPRTKQDRLPISLELEIETIPMRLLELQKRIETVHDCIKYNPHDADTMYTRLWLRYAHEAVQGALNSFEGLNKHLASIGMSITAVKELSDKLALSENASKQDGAK